MNVGSEDTTLQAIMFNLSSYKTLPQQLQDVLNLRPLRADDHLKGYLDLLCDEDTKIVDGEKRFQHFFSQISSIPEMYYPVVVENVRSRKIVGAGTLIVEQKFIHEAAVRSRIEDVHISEEYQDQGLKSLVMEALAVYAEKIGCYKVNMAAPLHSVNRCEELKLVHEPGQNIMVVPHPKNQNTTTATINNKSML